MFIQKKGEEKFCNCRNSKCMKLYCQCFAARQQCNKNCHCLDCHNQDHTQHPQLFKDFNNSERKTFKDQVVREHKGCACRKSGCTKKYCQCYQAGLLCKDLCKCVQCQNNESLSNKKVMADLKRSNSVSSVKGTSLYPIILTQNHQHLKQILADSNPLNIKDQWIQKTAQELYKKANAGSVPFLIEKVLDILNDLQISLTQAKKQELHFLKEESMEQQMNEQQQMNERQQNIKQDQKILHQMENQQVEQYLPLDQDKKNEQ